ncbi:alpha/beta hydrolase [Rothia sp. ARF10]|nr:alpha/beta hydrolase [Rothia sp. ARF10]
MKKWSPSTLDTAETNLRAARRSMLDLADELETMGLPKRWTGDASVTARSRLRTVSQDLKDVVAEVSAAYTAVCDAADGVRGVELAVEAVSEYARLHSLAVSDTGWVTDAGPAIDTGNAHDDEIARGERQGWVTECVDRIEQALRKAEDVDADLSAVLEKIELDRIRVTTGGLATASRVGAVEGNLSMLEPPPGGTVSENAAWWATLSPDEREEVIARTPRWIGNLDGVDFTSRDLANRNLLDDRRARVEELLADPSTSAAERESLLEEQASIRTIDEMLGREGEHQLVGLDFVQERTQAIVVNGNLDTADNVAVFTPGMTSNVPGMAGYDANMLDLKKRMEDVLLAEGDTRADGTPKTVATVTWMGYQAPQALPDLSVVSQGPADRGAEDLANFYRGINSSRVADPDLTALGHSYGSTTTGLAVQHENTGVDRTVLFGSPGAGTDDIDDYNTPSGSTYYSETYDDPVGDIGRFGADPSGLDGVTQLETTEATDADGRTLTESRGHSQYLHDGTTSQHNMAAIAAGHEEQVVEDDGQGFWGGLRDDASDALDDAKEEVGRTLREEYEEKKEWAGRLKDWIT